MQMLSRNWLPRKKVHLPLLPILLPLFTYPLYLPSAAGHDVVPRMMGVSAMSDLTPIMLCEPQHRLDVPARACVLQTQLHLLHPL